ncbi:nuclease EXOG, mitochondrial isoform X1 [Latimeria chalumnae]|uniref:nuclease EXOG, mitochondrial isoform X1 n=1 Tax=Latimeria chalumnae TaxID=7897 RepID=UPI0003C18DCA|nr:PREDICTED: nuclease EXOG, mitochondrial isoform X1 [Latimeria chalumnae]|eukprot:XP_006003439.1 PREDICTED: nuclease EXOG, mitochondrial isoform X1 [Latimeria chalumnae]
MAGRLRAAFQARFVGGFVCGAALGTASCLAALQLSRKANPEPEEPAYSSILEQYGFPDSGAEVRYYSNHMLSYDQAKRVPRWVMEHLSKDKILGAANRKHCKFKPDPSIPVLFTATNRDYLGSGWSRGHMSPAGDNKFSMQAMAETFYLSNIVPQNYENNAGFWNRLEMYCRELTTRFEDIWVATGPLTLPREGTDGKKRVSYQVIGNDDVAVPTHLYKVILAKKSRTSSEPLTLGAFVVPNEPIGFDHQLPEFQVKIQDLEKMSGLVFFPRVDKVDQCQNLCEIDTCKLIGYEAFTLYISGRKVQSAKTLNRLEKVMSELKELGIEPDEYLFQLYQEKKQELASKTEESNARNAKSG